MKKMLLFPFLFVFLFGYTQNVKDKTEELGFGFLTYTWDKSVSVYQGSYVKGFFTLGIGFSVFDDFVYEDEHSIEVEFRFSNDGVSWGEWQHVHFETTPEETPTNMFWSHLIFSNDSIGNKYFQVVFPKELNSYVKQVRVDVSELPNKESKGGGFKKLDLGSQNKVSSNCPDQPIIHPRSTWMTSGHYPQTFPLTKSDVKVLIVHHSGSPGMTSVPNPQATLYGHWNYHVNSLGWTDVAYNYAIDPNGEIYIARNNPYFPNTDVSGGATKYMSSNSVAIVVLGNYDNMTTTPIMIKKLKDFLAWKSNFYGLSPSSTFTFMNKTMYQVCGHKDAPMVQKSCPGKNLYPKMKELRDGTKAILDSCKNSLGDNVKPTVKINVLPISWKINDFYSSFSDADNTGGSGVKSKFFRVDNRLNSSWYSNFNRGFLNDDYFNSNYSYTKNTGIWNLNNGMLYQIGDVAAAQYFTDLNQGLSDEYLYHWRAKIEGNGTNKRAGLHFMATTTQDNGGSGYFAYFREDSDLVELYRVANNVWTRVAYVGHQIDAGVFYDFKVINNKKNGDIHVFVNDKLVLKWNDLHPIKMGSKVSMRAGNCDYTVDYLRVYRSRNSNELIKLGFDSLKNDIFIQNECGNSHKGGKITSFNLDYALNFSNYDSVEFNVDFTKPQFSSKPKILSYTKNSFTFNRPNAFDSSSCVSAYRYALGVFCGDGSVKNWTTQNNTSVTVFDYAIKLENKPYYLSYQVRNQAGVWSDIVCDSVNVSGLFYADFDLSNLSSGNPNNTWSVCVGDSFYCKNASVGAVKYQWLLNGVVKSTNKDFGFVADNQQYFDTTLTYYVTLVVEDASGKKDFHTDTLWVHVPQEPKFNYFTNGDTVTFVSEIIGSSGLGAYGGTYILYFGNGDSINNFVKGYVDTSVYVYSKPGSYKVTYWLTNYPGCEMAKTKTIYVGIASVADNHKEIKSKVYYNSYTNMINVSSEFVGDKMLEVYDYSGKLLHRDRFVQQQHIVGLNELPVSIFLIKLTQLSDGYTETFKILNHN